MADLESDANSEDDQPPAPSWKEPRWPAAIAIVVALGLYLALPPQYVVGHRLLLPCLEVVLLIPLLLSHPDRVVHEGRWMRIVSILLIAVISVANLTSLGLLVRSLLRGSQTPGTELVFAAIAIWGTSVLVFSLWYWELDGGGPHDRHKTKIDTRDFLFVQDASKDVFTKLWFPTYFDYLYVSFTNSTAFSPTDTMPLSFWSKLLMMVQSAAAFITVALVAARAINILS
ncbi:MAG: hypothetical protein WCK41_08030 [Actinomycetes bacterium]